MYVTTGGLLNALKMTMYHRDERTQKELGSLTTLPLYRVHVCATDSPDLRLTPPQPSFPVE